MKDHLITLDSSFFENAWAESFCKAVQDCVTIRDWRFMCADTVCHLFVLSDQGKNGYPVHDVSIEITFRLSDLNKNTDWKCLANKEYTIRIEPLYRLTKGREERKYVYDILFSESIKKKHDPYWLSKQKGITVTEVEGC
jgi:hypothetical protein